MSETAQGVITSAQKDLSQVLEEKHKHRSVSRLLLNKIGYKNYSFYSIQ